MTRLLLAEDHPATLEGMKSLLSQIPGFDIRGTACNPAQLTELCSKVPSNVLVMDYFLTPDERPGKLLERLRKTHPNMAIVVISAHFKEAIVHEAYHLGASSFLSKSSDPAHLTDAVRAAAAGQRYFSPECRNILLQHGTRARLSPRENIVLQYLCEGHSNKEIADMLKISEPTVKQHVSTLFVKMNTKDRLQTVLESIRRGLAILS